MIHQQGGYVEGEILVLNLKVEDRAEAIDLLWERESRPSRESIKWAMLGGLDVVLYCNLEANIAAVDLTPDKLGAFAVESVTKAPARNAIAYLRANIERGVVTPLTDAYSSAILRLTGARDLREAEALVAGPGR